MSDAEEDTRLHCWVSIGRNAWKPARVENVGPGWARIESEGEIRDVHPSCLVWKNPEERRSP